MTIEYAIIVRSKTRLEALIERFNTRAQAKFYLERSGGNFQEYQSEHDTFCRALETLQAKLSRVLKNKLLDRSHLPNYIFSENQLIIVIGQDGLVANTAKYAGGIPIIAVNPDHQRYDGVLLPFAVDDFLAGIEAVIAHQYRARTLRFAEVSLNDGQRLLGFNDLFIGAASHISARYRIRFGDRTEDHSSSGIIVSTPAGATGWLSSLFNMAYGLTGLFEQNLDPKRPTLKEDQLLFAVREPFQSVRTQIGLTAGFIDQDHSLTIESHMPTQGLIFSDGIEQDFLHFNSGAVATVGLSDASARLVVNPAGRALKN